MSTTLPRSRVAALALIATVVAALASATAAHAEEGTNIGGTVESTLGLSLGEPSPFTRVRAGHRQSMYDATIAVVAREQLREQRAASRGHALTAERAARQLTQEEKAQRATYVVQNDGSVLDLERKLSGVLDKLGR